MPLNAKNGRHAAVRTFRLISDFTLSVILVLLALMEIEFDDPDCDQLETDPKFSAGFADHLVRAYRKVIGIVRGANDERDLYAMRGLRFKSLEGARTHQHSLRLNDQWRLIVELRGRGTEKVVYVIGIEDYH